MQYLCEHHPIGPRTGRAGEAELITVSALGRRCVYLQLWTSSTIVQAQPPTLTGTTPLELLVVLQVEHRDGTRRL